MTGPNKANSARGTAPVPPDSGATPLPLVTVIMPMRNEEAFLGRCLSSVAATHYPVDRLELLVMDGASTDSSVKIAESFHDRLPGIRVIANPGRIQAAAFNLGLSEARGEIIVRMDAHAEYGPDYLPEAVRLLTTSGAANVGGPQRAVGESSLTRAIAVAVSSRFGAGDASYRYAVEPTWTDTVFLGAWQKTTLERLGGMRPDWSVNEDYEMNYRLRSDGGRILVSPSMQVSYFVRGSIPKLARQYFRYGFWKVRTLTLHPKSLRWRQLAAPGLLGYLLLLPAGWSLVGPVAVLPGLLYLVAVGATAASAAGLGKDRLWLPIVYPAIHLSWGLGFLLGWFRWLPPGRR